MLARADKLKLPIGLIPNGFNNATCRSMGIVNLENALDLIVNAEVIPVDSIRVLIDHETPEEIPLIDKDVLDHCRYMLNDCLLAMSSRVANKASRYKKRCYCFGRRYFITAALQETIFGSRSPDMFTIEVDGVRIDTDRKETTSSVIFMLSNGKFTDGGGVVDPFACMNDGLVDLTWLHDEKRQGLFAVGDFWIKAKKKHASQVFDRTSTYTRGRKIKLAFNGVKGKKEPNSQDWGKQSLTIDGEELCYNKFVVFECLPGNVEFYFNSKSYFKQFKCFN
jgi:diacylglycerol kinase family enzyme